jgi:DNA topoisomerase IB
LQAVGRDAAGRLQYRYHPQWEDVRESSKARRLARLAHALPQVRRSIGQYLAADQQTREFACAAVIELVACSAIRPGGEDYRRLHGTRGAATLLKSNVSIYGEAISLRFRSKGGKIVTKEFAAPIKPAASPRQRRKQVLEAVSAAAEDLANTPTICRRSYVHETVVAAFEDGVLERFSATLKNCRSPTRRAKVLAQIIAATGSSGFDVAGAVRRRT